MRIEGQHLFPGIIGIFSEDLLNDESNSQGRHLEEGWVELRGPKITHIKEFLGYIQLIYEYIRKQLRVSSLPPPSPS